MFDSAGQRRNFKSVMSQSATVEAPKNILTVTEAAIAQIRTMWQDCPEDQGKPLRVYVEQGGCSGMQYGLVFDEVRDGDAVHEFEGVSVVVDAVSAGYLAGSTVDFSDSLTSGGFKITNPQAKQNCGCGRSFEA
jgi:iron-sulfur cluster assembly accessory protein